MARCSYCGDTSLRWRNLGERQPDPNLTAIENATIIASAAPQWRLLDIHDRYHSCLTYRVYRRAVRGGYVEIRDTITRYIHSHPNGPISIYDIFTDSITHPIILEELSASPPQEDPVPSGLSVSPRPTAEITIASHNNYANVSERLNLFGFVTVNGRPTDRELYFRYRLNSESWVRVIIPTGSVGYSATRSNYWSFDTMLSQYHNDITIELYFYDTTNFNLGPLITSRSITLNCRDFLDVVEDIPIIEPTNAFILLPQQTAALSISAIALGRAAETDDNEIIRWRGVFSRQATYANNDIVFDENDFYIYKNNDSGNYVEWRRINNSQLRRLITFFDNFKEDNIVTNQDLPSRAIKV